MKHIFVKFGLLAALLAIMVSCHKEKQTISDLIIGKWEWIKTIIPSNPKDYKITNSTILNSPFYFESDTLIFSEAYVDGPVYYYVRKQ